MAQTTFINITLDANAAKKAADNHAHSSARGASASGDVTLSFDKATVKTRSVLRTAVLAALRQVEAGNELTP